MTKPIAGKTPVARRRAMPAAAPPAKARGRSRGGTVAQAADAASLAATPPSAAAPAPIDAETRRQMICERAYAIYASRGCADGGDVADWLQAEAEIDRLLT
jgi:hypothetical protein